MPLVTLSKKDVDKCEMFAEKVSGTMGYVEQRGQDSKSRKIFYDWLGGRLGEMAVWRLRGSKDNEQPDSEIGGKSKSFGGDVGIHHVKSQWAWMGKRFGWSWTVQLHPNPDNHLLKGTNPLEMLYGCFIGKQKDDGCYRVNVCIKIPVPEVKKYLDEPTKKSLSKHKRAIYNYKIPSEYRI